MSGSACPAQASITSSFSAAAKLRRGKRPDSAAVPASTLLPLRNVRRESSMRLLIGVSPTDRKVPCRQFPVVCLLLLPVDVDCSRLPSVFFVHTRPVLSQTRPIGLAGAVAAEARAQSGNLSIRGRKRTTARACDLIESISTVPCLLKADSREPHTNN